MVKLHVCAWMTLVLFLWQAEAKHLILLKKSETLERFLNYDFGYPVPQRLMRLIKQTYHIGNLVGFSGEFSVRNLDRIKKCPLVAEVAADTVFEAFDFEEQEYAPGHLVELSREFKETGDRTSYFYDSDAQGEGVNVYVIDTGVQGDHPEFENRVSLGKDFTSEGPEDLNGHGTHVAGIVGSRTYGVSKEANIISVKTLDKSGHGSLSSILGAIEFAVNDRQKRNQPGIANLSLGAKVSSILNRVVDSACETGLVIVVAGGNSNMNACDTSPASASLAISVGAVDESTSSIASFSNWGPCIDIFATGVDISSVDIGHWRRSRKLSGTSMAAPIISGLVANWLSSGMDPKQAKQRVLELATRGAIDEQSIAARAGSPNLVAYNGCDPWMESIYDSD